MVAIFELKVIPLGSGASVSRLVAEAVKVLRDAGVKHEVNPMSTVFEAPSAEEGLRLALKAHEAVFKAGAVRVQTFIVIDERRDVEHSMERKTSSLEAKLKA